MSAFARIQPTILTTATYIGTLLLKHKPAALIAIGNACEALVEGAALVCALGLAGRRTFAFTTALLRRDGSRNGSRETNDGRKDNYSEFHAESKIEVGC
jgi:hypothetical protein